MKNYIYILMFLTTGITLNAQNSFSASIDPIFTYADDIDQCKEVNNLSVSATEMKELHLSWDEVSGVEGYEYFVVLKGNDPVMDNLVTWGCTSSANITSMNIEGVDADLEYDIYMRVLCDIERSGRWAMVSSSESEFNEGEMISSKIKTSGDFNFKFEIDPNISSSDLCKHADDNNTYIKSIE